MRQRLQLLVLLVPEFLSNSFVVLLQEHQAELLGGLLVFYAEGLQLLVHLLLEASQVFVLNSANSDFIEYLQCFLFRLLV